MALYECVVLGVDGLAQVQRGAGRCVVPRTCVTVTCLTNNWSDVCRFVAMGSASSCAIITRTQYMIVSIDENTADRPTKACGPSRNKFGHLQKILVS